MLALFCACILTSCSNDSQSLPDPTIDQKLSVATTIVGAAKAEAYYNRDGYYPGFAIPEPNKETFTDCQVNFTVEGISYSVIINGTSSLSGTSGNYTATMNCISTYEGKNYHLAFAVSTTKGFVQVTIDGVSYNPSAFNS